MNKYYQQEQIIQKVDRKGKSLGKIEKWEAHKKGILHKGFSAILKYNGYYLLQHRKHPLFDGLFDLTISSHQKFYGNVLQKDEDAAIEAVMREWKIAKENISGKPKYIGKVYYKAKDVKGEFTEHEMCDLLEIRINKIPLPNLEYAYGFSLATKEELRKDAIYKNLCPWSQKAIAEL